VTDAAPPSAPQTEARPATDHTWPMLCHLAALASFVLPFLGSVIGPLVVWLARRDVDPAVREHGKEALNFNISFVIWHCVAFPFVFILIGYLFLAVIFVTWIALLVIATIKASDGIAYRYPFTIRFID
jgi:uncharacterized Tic20 family protein